MTGKAHREDRFCPKTGRRLVTHWPPARDDGRGLPERYCGKWPPRFKTPKKPTKKAKPKSPVEQWYWYTQAMLERHGSVEAWHAARDAELGAQMSDGRAP
jgi:hypothetical protein